MGLGKPGRLRVDQPTITGELGPAPDAYTHYSRLMIAGLSKTAGRNAFDEAACADLSTPRTNIVTRVPAKASEVLKSDHTVSRSVLRNRSPYQSVERCARLDRS